MIKQKAISQWDIAFFISKRPSDLSENDPVQLLAEDDAVVIVHKAEAVSVVGGAEIVPDTVGNIPFLKNGDDISHPILTPFYPCVTDGAELTAPEHLIGVLFNKILGRGQVAAEEFDIHPVILTVGIAVAVNNSVVISVALNILAGIGHFAVVKQLTRLQNALLMGKFVGCVAVEGVYDIFIVIDLDLRQGRGIIPLHSANDDKTLRVL